MPMAFQTGLERFRIAFGTSYNRFDFVLNFTVLRARFASTCHLSVAVVSLRCGRYGWIDGSRALALLARSPTCEATVYTWLVLGRWIWKPPTQRPSWIQRGL